MKKVIKALNKGKVIGVTALTASAMQAQAAVPTSVTEGFADAVTDVTTIGGLALGLLIVIMGFMWLRRPIK